MARIGILLDYDHGHIYPALGVAQKIRELGHDVQLVGIPDVEDYVKGFGFQFSCIFKKIYPIGFLSAYRELQKYQGKTFTGKKAIPRPHIDFMLNGDESIGLEDLGLDFLFITYSLCLEALILSYICTKIEVIILTTWLRSPKLDPVSQAQHIYQELNELSRHKIRALVNFSDIERIFFPLKNFKEVITCPKEFELPENLDSSPYYLNSCLRENLNSKTFFDKLNIPVNKKVIYASLGSQVVMYKERAESLIALIYKFMELKTSSDFLLLLSIGKDLFLKDYGPIPNRIMVFNWVPQLELLKHVSLVITHGGLGTIKECICSGVPILAVPLGNDQFENGIRVEHHGIGSAMDLNNLTELEIDSQVRKILQSKSVNEKIQKMRGYFNKDDSSVFVEILKKQPLSHKI